VKKSLDNHANEIMDPEKMKTELAKYKTFTEEMSIKLTDTFKWNKDALKHLAKVNLDGFILLFLENQMANPAFKKYLAETRKPVDKPAEAPSAEQKPKQRVQLPL
jgi:hypothetical protein